MKVLLVLALATAIAACAKTGRGTEVASESSAAEKNPASASDGASIYLANCSSCHQPNGEGVPGAFPPLAQNPAVTGAPVAVIAIVKEGLTGRLVVNGQAYSGIMPAWKGVLSDEEIASAISYIRSSWKNQASGVSAADVAAVK